MQLDPYDFASCQQISHENWTFQLYIPSYVNDYSIVADEERYTLIISMSQKPYIQLI